MGTRLIKAVCRFLLPIQTDLPRCSVSFGTANPGARKGRVIAFGAAAAPTSCGDPP